MRSVSESLEIISEVEVFKDSTITSSLSIGETEKSEKPTVEFPSTSDGCNLTSSLSFNLSVVSVVSVDCSILCDSSRAFNFFNTWSHATSFSKYNSPSSGPYFFTNSLTSVCKANLLFGKNETIYIYIKIKLIFKINI